jgi:hypothetical protein
MKRPPLISPMVAAAFAVIPGFRCSDDMTQVPILIRDVATASADGMAIAVPEAEPRAGGDEAADQLIGTPDRVEADRLRA